MCEYATAAIKKINTRNYSQGTMVQRVDVRDKSP